MGGFGHRFDDLALDPRIFQKILTKLLLGSDRRTH
jgi:hypothetical protein